MPDDKEEFTYSWNQALHILALSDLCLLSQKLLGLRPSAVNFCLSFELSA